MAAYPDELWQAVADLSGLLLATESLETTLARVADLAVRCVSGCDAVGVTLFADGRATTRAATGGLVYEVDHYQYDVGDGPCLSTVREGEVHEIEDMSSSTRWPEFCGHAAERGINSSVSFPLLVRGDALGALNFYSRSARAFAGIDRSVPFAFAAQAAVALANAETYATSIRLAEQLREALVSRSVIDQAKGILMAQQTWDQDEAFEALKAISSRRNVKLRQVCVEIVAAIGATDGVRPPVLLVPPV